MLNPHFLNKYINPICFKWFGVAMDFFLILQETALTSPPLLAAFLIGLINAISPCPLATNLSAVAFLSKEIENPKRTILLGFLFALGRVLTYAGIASAIAFIGISAADVFFPLKILEPVIGIALILAGLMMLGFIGKKQQKCDYQQAPLLETLAKKGYAGAFLLGVVFALAFCPVSAVLYFGMLIPLSITESDPFIIPFSFGIATALPLIIASLLIVNGMSIVGKFTGKLHSFEQKMNTITGTIFVAAGIYLTIQAILFFFPNIL
jgi:cytochrome c-type biogenesis protein